MAILERIRVRIVEQATPPPFDVTAFSGPAGPFEVGQSVATPAFTASYNRTPVAASLSDTDGNPAEDVSATPAAFSSSNTYAKTGIGDAVTWTLNAADAFGSDQAQHSVSWLPLVYTGIAPFQANYSEAEVEALAQQVLQASAAKTTSLSPVNQAIVHAYPASYGPLTNLNFQIGDLGPGDMAEVQTSLLVTNVQGETLTYRVARSDFALTAPGGINFTVSP